MKVLKDVKVNTELKEKQRLQLKQKADKNNRIEVEGPL